MRLTTRPGRCAGKHADGDGSDGGGGGIARLLSVWNGVAGQTAGRTNAWGTTDYISQKFTGQERDSETDLDHFPARHFASAMGRFMTPDPVGNLVADATNPQSWNMYGYALNSPLVYVDPFGLDSILPCINGVDPQSGNFCATGTGNPWVSGNPSTYSNCLSFAGCFAPGTCYGIIIDGDYSGSSCTGGGGGGTPTSGPGKGGGTPPPSPPKVSFPTCMLQNQGSFSLGALIDQGSAAAGYPTHVSETFVGNLLAGNDIMGVVSLAAGVDPNGSLATAVGRSEAHGVEGGLGTPLKIGGNSPGAVQRLFPKRGRQPQVLARSKNLFESKALSSLAGMGLDLLDGKDVVDLAMTAGLAFRCVE